MLERKCLIGIVLGIMEKKWKNTAFKEHCIVF